jgi:MFS family permease
MNTPTTSAEERHNTYRDAIARHVRRNWLSEILSNLLLRMGWILKNETVVVAGFIHQLTDNPLVLSLQPFISRIGPNLPQLFVAGRVGALRRKKPFLIAAMLFYTLCWGSLAVLIFWAPGLPAGMLLVIFFAIYALFRLAQGLTALTRKTLEGKLIPAELRGRIIAFGAPVFGLASLLAAPWLSRVIGETWLPFPLNYGLLFAVGSGLFLCAVGTTFLLREPEHPEELRGPRIGEVLRAAVELLVTDRNYLRLVVGTNLVSFTFFLNPHYRAFGADVLEVPEWLFGYCLPAQYVAQALGFLLIGYGADVRGNRWALCLTASLAPLVPLTAVTLWRLGLPSAYFLLYALIGMMPMVMRLTPNYILEIAPAEKHALYLAANNTIRMVGALLSLAVGWAIGRLTHVPVFFITAGITAFGAWLLYGLTEPRQHRRPEFEPEPGEL